MRLGAQFTARLCRLPKQELKIPKSSAAVSPKTIFAFLMLDTPRSAHKEILSAKFLSLERAAIVC